MWRWLTNGLRAEDSDLAGWFSAILAGALAIQLATQWWHFPAWMMLWALVQSALQAVDKIRRNR